MANTSLSTFRFPQGTSIAQAQPPQHALVTTLSPALSVMTDLTQIRAATVPPGLTLAQTELSMIHQGVRLLFVVNNQLSVDGIITSGDLHGERPMRQVHQRGIKYESLTVTDVMTPLSEINAIDYGALKHATVAKVVDTLLNSSQPHLLVIEHASDTAPVRIRGIISKTQVERQLGTQLQSREIANSFAEIEQALA